MKRSIALLTVLFAFAIFAMPTYAGPPGPPVYVSQTEVVNEPIVNVAEKEPFQHTEVGTNSEKSSYLLSTFDIIPDGKRLVIEYISASVKIDDPASAQLNSFSLSSFFVYESQNIQGEAKYNIPMSKMGGNFYQGGQKVIGYGNPETPVELQISFTEDSDFVYSFTISGYLVPVSTP